MAPIPQPLQFIPTAPHENIANIALRSPSIAKSATQTLSGALQILKRNTHEILKRQSLTGTNNEIIPTTYGQINSGPAPSTVAGIVLGSVGGFLLVLWLIYTCATLGDRGGSDYTESVVVARRKSHGSRSTRSRRMSETIEVRRDAPPLRVVPVSAGRVEHVVVEESRKTRRERSRGSDEVVVIEDHSPPRRTKSKRKEGRDSGYRTVDANSYGGVVGGRRGSSSRR